MNTSFLTQKTIDFRRLPLVAGLVLLALGLVLPGAAQAVTTVTANVVAMDQVLVYNRMGAFNPAGMIFALARDVFPIEAIAPFTEAKSCRLTQCTKGQVQLRPDKRPRPLTLRVNEGDKIAITLTNLLALTAITDAVNENPEIELPPGQSEQPFTRNVGIHIQGMQWVNANGADDGSKVGAQDSLVAPGNSDTYTLYAEREGAYAITSGPNLGGEGNSGAIASGLFGVLNVEPADSIWYRSQLTRAEMEMATTGTTIYDHPILDYDAVYPPGHPYADKPILKILDDSEIFHSDLNAVIAGVSDGPATNIYPNRGEPFREFTVAFHDEIKVVQAFPDWFAGTGGVDPGFAHTLPSVKDGFAINYGSGGIGAEIIANRLGKGPMKNCTDCKYEEFFLTSWAVGDPAMIVDVPATISDPTATPDPIVATKAFYPDDPSNVWHGYLNDRTKIRNIHVGSEHHLFHLHAHQWLFAPDDDNSNYLDAQAIGPGSAFTYEIAYGGGGNRNKTAGDSIFHCHFYPHFAQGMWGLWRVHDVFEMGTELDVDGIPAAGSRALPDGEIAAGTPIPAVVPLPTKAMAPMPAVAVAIDNGQAVIAGTTTPISQATGNPGYPFFIPGVAGHRPPTPPLDLVADGGLPRHVITGGTVHQVQTPLNFEKELLTATGFQLPEDGTPAEKAAMAFHGPQPGVFHSSFAPDGSPANFEVNGLPPVSGAPYAEPCRSDGSAYYGGALGTRVGNPRTYKASVIELDVQLNKVGWHFNQQRILVLDNDVGVTQAGSRAPEPFVMRANTNDCVDFDHTNLVPSVYAMDDFQVRTPTDVIGQHIHLVKFDVTSADGSANGWNYEDGTFSPDEIVERIQAFQPPYGSFAGTLGSASVRTTRQRWYIDPVLNNAQQDRGLGNVFTHDHLGPSTHQQAGLYATLLVEPKNSTWKDPETGIAMGTRDDGGPTSWRADIINGADSYREFYLEFADFQLAYRTNGTPVNPPGRAEVGLPFILQRQCPPPFPPNGPCPEAISAEDPGTFVVNYRNEPLALRIRDPETNTQAAGLGGDLSHAFNSNVTRDDARLNAAPAGWPYGIQTANQGTLPGDPFTPLLRVYPGDDVSIRVQVGAHEEGHNFNIHGVEWLQQFSSGYSGFRNSQMMGISEYFRFEVPPLGKVRGDAGFDDYLYEVGSSVDARWNGPWGFMRAYEDIQENLQPLPSNSDGGVPSPKGNPNSNRVCPEGTPVRHFAIAAVSAGDVLPDLEGHPPSDPLFDGGTLVYNARTILGGPLHDPTALMYVMADDLLAVDPEDPRCLKQVGKGKKPKFVVDPTLPGCPVTLADTAPIEPLILRAAAGECIEVDLFNKVLQQAVDSIGAPVFNADGNPVFVDEGPPHYTDQQGQVAAVPPIIWDEITDLDGFNTMPMIVEEFNANQVRPSSEVGLHAQLVDYDVAESDGWNVGFNPIQTAPPGGKVTYQWYAGQIEVDSATGALTHIPVEYGAINLMPADPIKHSNKGLIGGLVIEPQNSTWTEDLDADGKLTRASATVCPDGEDPCITDKAHFRDFVVIMQDDINMRFAADDSPVPIVSDEEDPEDSGMKAINYRTDPIWLRLGIGPTADPVTTRTVDFTNAFAGADPVTPIFTAAPGEEVRFRVLKPGGHNRNHVFALHGHLWARHPFNDDSTEIDRDNPYTFWHGEQMGHGPTNHVNVVPLGGAGVAGDYLYRDMTPVHVYNGIWGIFRVE